jgi:NACHT domain
MTRQVGVVLCERLRRDGVPMALAGGMGMTGLEGTLLAVGKAVATRAGSLWLADRRSKQERASDLSSLIRLNFSDRFLQRGVERQIDSIADDVAQRLEPFRIAEFGGLPENERLAALTAVTETFMTADLGDEAFFDADADPIKLSRQLRMTTPDAAARSLLSEAAARYYDLVLAECCDCYVRIVLQLQAFPPRALAESLSRLSSLSDQVNQVLKRLPARTIDAPAGTSLDEDFARRYLEFIATALDRVELYGIDLKHRSLATLSVAYLSLSVTREAGDERRAENGAPHAPSGVARIEAVLPRSRRLLLRGEAGSGKTTLLRWLAITAARGGFSEGLAGWNGYTPFLITLRTYAERTLPSSEEFLDSTAGVLTGIAPTGWVHRQLTEGRCLVMVDGVDEVPEGRRRDVRSWLSQLTNAYPQARFLVTARPAAAETDWLAAERFSTVRLEPMGPDDIRRLVVQWHEAVRHAGHLPCDEEELPTHRQALLARLEGNPRLRLLATSPLLCTMLCALNLDRRGYLPRNRMELYAAALEMLLERRDSQRGLGPVTSGLDLQQRGAILRDLAWRLAIRQESEAPKQKVVSWVGRRLTTLQVSDLEPETVVSHLLERSGLLREPVPSRIDFVHRTFLEYLAAEEAAEEDHIDLLVQRAHQSNWQEIIVLAAGHANTPLRRDLFAGLLKRIRTKRTRSKDDLRLLIVRCLETSTSVPEELRDEIENCVTEVVPPRSRDQIEALAGAGDAVLRRLPGDLAGLGSHVAEHTISLAALINGREALRLLAGYSVDPRYHIQDNLQMAWQRFDAEEYARQVLADSPLMEGLVLVSDLPRANAANRYLRNCTTLGLDLLGGPIFLDKLDMFPPLQLLLVGFADDLSPLRAQPGLRYLVLMGTEDATDFTPLQDLPNLNVLALSQCDQLSDLSVLRDHRALRYLAIQTAAPRLDVSDLASHTNLLLYLNYGPEIVGLEKLGSGVRVNFSNDLNVPGDLRHSVGESSSTPYIIGLDLSYHLVSK